jgi:hypothetical protein
MQADGLGNVSYDIVKRVRIPNMPEQRWALWEMVTAKLLMQPSREQLEASGNKART